MKFKKLYTKIIFLLISSICFAQNSMVGDGFGGRLWYNPTNYSVGSYSGYSLCYDICNSNQNQLYGWGSNATNQIGIGFGPPFGVNIPTLIPNMTNVKYYTSGYLTAAIKNDNTGWAWGRDYFIPAGISGSPIQVITDVKFVDAGATTISFIKIDGTIWSMGRNQYGSFGDGTISNTVVSSPIQMLNINTAVRVSNNQYATIILLNDSSVWSVGNNNNGRLGLGTSISSTLVPMQISGLPKTIDIKSNDGGTIALTDSGDVYFWGYTGFSIGTTNYTPIKLNNLSNIVAISACDDGGSFMALDQNKNCYVWGYNGYGNCGISSSTLGVVTPLLIASNVIDIMAGETFSYLVKTDGSLWAAGTSNGTNSSIWLNLIDVMRQTFTQINPSQVSSACELIGIIPYTTSCTDSTFGSINISNFGGQSPYTYSIGGAFQNSNIFDNLSAGNYTITVKDVNGCQYSTTVNVNGVNCPSPPTPIEPIPPQKEPHIHFPNVFSPNHDGENDLFYFPNEGVTEMYCKIYNRWGNLIYEFSQINEGWNGRTNSGVECPDGTYYFIVNYKKVNSDWETAKGFVTLLR